jgi:hypothetical protein
VPKKKIQLSAAVCKKCWITTVGKGWWTKQDKDRHLNGKGCCPPKYETNIIPAEVRTDSPPPRWCPYKLEHGVAKGMKNG